MSLKRKVCWECKGRQYVFKQNSDGSFSCEACVCLVYPKEMMHDEVP